MTPFKLVGGTDVDHAPAKRKRVVIDDAQREIISKTIDEVIEERMRSGPDETLDRSMVLAKIQKFEEAKTAYAEAVTWEAAWEAHAESPSADQIEDARTRCAKAFEEMEYRGQMLLVAMPHDLRGLVDMMMYMEKNFSLLPQEMDGKSLALTLLRTVRLSLRHVQACGKFGPSS
jgi:hypothetical protein